MLRIPVCMHNVSEENIFRPSAWTAFGEDMEGSDYRACKIMDLSINKGNRRYVEINQLKNTLLVGATAILVSCGGQKEIKMGSYAYDAQFLKDHALNILNWYLLMGILK